MRITWRLSGFIEILRPHNLLISAITTLLGYAATYVVVGGSVNLSAYIPTAVVVLIAAGGYVLNDYYDIYIDSVNKPARPIPSGRVSKNEALVLGLVLTLAGILTAFLIGPLSLLFAVLNALLLILYSRSIKAKGLLGNLVISLTSANSIIFGGLAVSESLGNVVLTLNTLLPASYAFTFILMREIVKGVEDVIGDSVRGVRSLALKRGVRYASKVSAALALIIVAISPLPFLLNNYGVLYLGLAAITDAILLYSAYYLIKSRSDGELIMRSSKARTYTKIAMFTGTSAFLLDIAFRLYLTT